MIKLNKLPSPQWLLDNQAVKTAQYISAPTDNKPSPWRNPEVVSALKSETSSKCMYCESFIDDSGYSAVEHIKPKKVFPTEILIWDNLGLACGRCNTNKGEYWTADPDLRLLDPFVDEISSHIGFRGPLTLAALQSSRGENTLRKLKFYERPDLFQSRLIVLEDFDRRLRLWANAADPDVQELYSEDVEAAMTIGREFCGMLRAHALSRGFTPLLSR